MTAGNIPPNPSELLVSEEMIKLIDELNEICDIVIIDGTPCELVTDSVILSSVTDSTLIVTAYKSTRKDSLDRIIKNIQNVGGNLVGVVVNKMPMSAKKYYGNYYASIDGNYSKGKKNKKANDNIDINKKTKATSKHMKNKSNSTNKETKVNKEISSKKKKKSNEIKQNKQQEHKENHDKNNQDLEKPEFLKNKVNTENLSDRTKDILDQMNLYYNKGNEK